MCWKRISIAFLIAIWMSTPDVLCLLPGGTSAMDEHECCRHMAGQCGDVPMPDFHNWCKNVTRTNVVITAKATDYPEVRVAAFQDTATPEPVLAAPERWGPFENPKPAFLLASDHFQILRI